MYKLFLTLSVIYYLCQSCPNIAGLLYTKQSDAALKHYILLPNPLVVLQPLTACNADKISHKFFPKDSAAK